MNPKFLVSMTQGICREIPLRYLWDKQEVQFFGVCSDIPDLRALLIEYFGADMPSPRSSKRHHVWVFCKCSADRWVLGLSRLRKDATVKSVKAFGCIIR